MIYFMSRMRTVPHIPFTAPIRTSTDEKANGITVQIHLHDLVIFQTFIKAHGVMATARNIADTVIEYMVEYINSVVEDSESRQIINLYNYFDEVIKGDLV